LSPPLQKIEPLIPCKYVQHAFSNQPKKGRICGHAKNRRKCCKIKEQKVKCHCKIWNIATAMYRKPPEYRLACFREALNHRRLLRSRAWMLWHYLTTSTRDGALASAGDTKCRLRGARALHCCTTAHAKEGQPNTWKQEGVMHRSLPDPSNKFRETRHVQRHSSHLMLALPT